MKAMLMAGALALATAMGNAQPVQAQFAQVEGPWCASIMVGDDSMVQRCDMRSFEMCRQEVMGQGSSYCSQNPYYRGAAGREPIKEPRRRARTQ